MATALVQSTPLACRVELKYALRVKQVHVNPPHLFAEEIAVAGMMGEVEIESESRKAIFRVLFGASCEKRCSNQEYSYEICFIHSFFYFLRLKFYFQVFVSPLGDTKPEC